jgi:hypothetical protein
MSVWILTAGGDGGDDAVAEEHNAFSEGLCQTLASHTGPAPARWLMQRETGWKTRFDLRSLWLEPCRCRRVLGASSI